MPRIVSVATAVPGHRITQVEAREICRKGYAGREDLERRLPVFDQAGVEARHFAFPADYYLSGKTFEERNADFIEKAPELLEPAVKEALEQAKVPPERIEHIIVVTTTGLAVPGLDALLVHRMGFRDDVRRTPIFGTGCAGGVAALARAMEYVRAYPKHHALALSVELSGQLFSTKAHTKTDLVGAALFGDGAAAAVVGGDEAARTGPRMLFSRSDLFPGTEKVVALDFTGDGMRLVLSEDLPSIIGTYVKPAVESFILRCAMSPSKFTHWILHPGGPRVMDAYEKAFDLSRRTLAPVSECMRDYGNLGSAASLFILKSAMERAKTREAGIMVGLGPGFAAEMMILRW